MIYELNHVGMRVRDLSASLHVYVDVLGAKVVDELYVESGQTDRVHLQVAGGLIELLHPHHPREGTTWGVDHIGFMTDDLDGDHTRLVERGFTFSVPPRVAGSGQGRLAFCSDPNGVRVELLQREEEFRIPKLEDGPVRALAHVSLMAPDLEAAETFYRDDLSMRPVRTATLEDGGVRSYLCHGDDFVELANGAGLTSDRPIRGIALRVSDVDATADQLRAEGIDVDRAGAFSDPDGTRVELVSTEA
jgi:catechol 2,3-dioxygenase-like lactoylglutathione lyase family enzyme